MAQMDLERMREMLETVSADEESEINGTAEQFDEELAVQGQQLWWDGATYFIGPIEPEAEQ